MDIFLLCVMNIHHNPLATRHCLLCIALEIPVSVADKFDSTQRVLPSSLAWDSEDSTTNRSMACQCILLVFFFHRLVTFSVVVVNKEKDSYFV